MCQKLSQTAEAWILSPAVGVQVESSKWRETAHSAALCPHTPRETGIQPHISEDHKSLPWICNLTAVRSWVIPPVRIISCLRIGEIVPPSSSEDVKSSCHVFFVSPWNFIFILTQHEGAKRGLLALRSVGPPGFWVLCVWWVVKTCLKLIFLVLSVMTAV